MMKFSIEAATKLVRLNNKYWGGHLAKGWLEKFEKKGSIALLIQFSSGVQLWVQAEGAGTSSLNFH